MQAQVELLVLLLELEWDHEEEEVMIQRGARCDGYENGHGCCCFVCFRVIDEDQMMTKNSWHRNWQGGHWSKRSMKKTSCCWCCWMKKTSCYCSCVIKKGCCCVVVMMTMRQ